MLKSTAYVFLIYNSLNRDNACGVVLEKVFFTGCIPIAFIGLCVRPRLLLLVQKTPENNKLVETNETKIIVSTHITPPEKHQTFITIALG